MATGFQPVGAALPPRRDMLVAAAKATPVPSSSDWGSSINVPLARDRMLEFFERDQLPGDVKSTLAAALHGDLNYQHLLFTSMIDTWPKLQKAIEEIARKVSVAPWKIHPYAARGEKPDSKAEQVAKDMEAIVWAMKPRVQYLEKGLEGTIRDLVRFYYYGHGVSETRWQRGADGVWKPRCTKTVPARYYGYPYDIETGENGEDRLMFDPEGGMGARRFEDFPENRFLIAINTGHGGHPSTAAPLRALAAYWLAAVYGLKWFMNFTQLYGIPWRHAEIGDETDRNVVTRALDEIGSSGRIVTKSGTKINILAPGSTSAASLPQRELVALADEQCDQFILGQTLTSSVSSDGGSRALGEVHQDTLNSVVDGVADFVGGVLTHQLIPAVVALNWGDSLGDELPEMWAKREEVKDEKSLAERDEKIGITSGKVPVGKAWFYERHGIPMPAEDDDLLVEETEEEDLTMQGGGDDWLDEDESDDDEDIQSVQASHVLIQARAAMKMPKAPGKSDKSKRKQLKLGSSRVPTGSGMGFDPNQTRIPKGQPFAGRWTDEGLVSKGQRARKGVMRDATAEDRKRLKIPPGFKDAKVTDDPKADLIATAVNAKGKPISFYSESYTKKQEAAKWGRISALNKDMRGLQKRIKADSEAGNHQALTMRLITASGMRNGGDKGGGRVPTFGASNLRTDQVKVSGETVSMDFIGKKGVRQLQTIKDPVLAKHISARQTAGKETVFDGNAGKTLGYLKEISKDKYKVHDFRTWNATIMADRTISKIQSKGQLPSNEAEYKAFQMRVARVVSRKLGNDPAMALKAYIHPAVFNGY